MNALANDQLERLRVLLVSAPDITFGRYTGETLDGREEAKAQFVQRHARAPLPNELLSRAEMQASPPHILLTNFAMLEYLLLRPRDVTLFENGHQGHWQFIVADEAHVYDGVKGAEIAMLLRRLRERVARGREIQCLASSATVGDDFSRVAAFGQSLFGVPFEWANGAGDVIGADRHPISGSATWGPLSPDNLSELADSHEPSAWLDQRAEGALGDEVSMQMLMRRLERGPQDVATLAQAVFPDAPEDSAQKSIVDLVAVGHRVAGAGGSPVLSARYHLFASGIEGAYACLSDTGPHVRLSRHEACPDCRAPMFEIAACKRCGQLHLHGCVERAGDIECFGLPAIHQPPHWLLVGDAVVDVDEDEDAHEPGVRDTNPLAATLCTACRAISGPGQLTCRCGSRSVRDVRRIDASPDLNLCRSCGGRSPRQVRRFLSGPDASAAVLATALYEHLPADVNVSFPGEGRRLLMFSDSRQQAAFAAPYLQNSYGSLLQRTLIATALKDQSPECLATSDLAAVTRQVAIRADVFDHSLTSFAQRLEVGTWLQKEMIEGDERNSLEGNDSRCGEPRQAELTGSGSALGTRPYLGRGVGPAGPAHSDSTNQGAVSPTEDNVDLTSENPRATQPRGVRPRAAVRCQKQCPVLGPDESRPTQPTPGLPAPCAVTGWFRCRPDGTA